MWSLASVPFVYTGVRLNVDVRLFLRNVPPELVVNLKGSLSLSLSLSLFGFETKVSVSVRQDSGFRFLSALLLSAFGRNCRF